MRSATSKRVILNPGTLNYLGHKNMVEFVLEELIMQNGNTIVILISVRPKPLFWFRSDMETETQIGLYFLPIL